MDFVSDSLEEFKRVTGLEINRPYAKLNDGIILWMTFHVYPISLRDKTLNNVILMSPSYVHEFSEEVFVVKEMRKSMIQYLN